MLNLLYEAYGFPGALPRPGMDPAQALAAPQAALMTTIAQGGEEAEAAGNRRGTLFASGLIVGESIIGVLLAGVIVVSVTGGGSDAPLALVGKDFAGKAEYLGLAVFAVSLLIFSKVVLGGSDK